MFLMHPFLLLVLAGFGAFMAVLLVASLRCSGRPAVEQQPSRRRPEAPGDHQGDSRG